MRSPEFDRALRQLQDVSQPFPTSSLYHLSDLAREDREALEAAWRDMPAERRGAIMQDLSEISEANFEVSFDEVFRLALEDDEPAVRAVAIDGLWESEDPSLIAPFIDFMLHDPDEVVRAAAAGALGRFVYLGEVEELQANIAHRVEDALLSVIGGGDATEVRRRALEAVAFSSRSDVPPLISEAYRSPEAKMRASAVSAMGRTADANRWRKPVRTELESPDPELRFQAARAAGELELADAAPLLSELVDDEDSQVKEAAIWSLGQVGGPVAHDALAALLERTADEAEQEFIEEALSNLAFTDELHSFTLFQMNLDGSDDADVDLDDEDDELDDGFDEGFEGEDDEPDDDRALS